MTPRPSSPSTATDLRPRLLHTSRRSRRGCLPSRAWIRLARGHYWLPDRDAERWQHRYTLSLARAVVAQRAQLSTAYLSHTSAALALELDVFSQEPDVYLAVSSAPHQVHTFLPRIWVPARGTPVLISEGPSESSGCRDVNLWRRRLGLMPDEIESVGETVTTTAVRTAYDCAFDEPAHNALAIADSVLRRSCQPDRERPELCSAAIDRVRREWARALKREPRRRGVAQARAVLGLATPFSESALESAVRWLVLVLGLPVPRVQYPIDTSEGRWWVDMCWPGKRIALEADGRKKYQGAEDLWKEKRRQDGIESQGWTVLRVSYGDMMRPDRLGAKILTRFPPGEVAHLQRRQELEWAGMRLEAGLREASLLGQRLPRGSTGFVPRGKGGAVCWRGLPALPAGGVWGLCTARRSGSTVSPRDRQPVTGTVYCTKVGIYWGRVGCTGWGSGVRAVWITLDQWIPTLVE